MNKYGYRYKSKVLIYKSFIKAKWIKRYEYLKTQENILLIKIENLMEEYNLFSRMSKMRNETSLQISNCDETESKRLISDFLTERTELSKQDISLMRNTPLKVVPCKEFCNLICGQLGSKEDIQMISLYLLNKLPGKPKACKRCGELVTKAHLVKCNFKDWAQLIIDMSEEMEIKLIFFKIGKFFTESVHWVENLIRSITEVKTCDNKTNMIAKVASLLKKSMLNCIWD